MSEDLRLTILGDEGSIGADVLHEALGEVLGLMRDAAKSLDAPVPTWRVSDIGTGSVYVAMNDPMLAGPGLLVRQGLNALRDAAVIPARWSPDMVKSIRNLGRLTGRSGTQGVSLRVDHDTIPIDGAITAHAAQALQATDVSWGSVTGTVERWNGHRREIGIVVDGQPNVTVRYHENMKQAILSDATDRKIEAWGELHRNAAGQPVSLELAGFEAAYDELPVPIDHIAGTLGGPDGIFPETVAEWLEENRGE